MTQKEHRCDLGEEMCPISGRSSSRRIIIFYNGISTIQLCKFQYLKSDTVKTWLEEQLQTISCDVQENFFDCLACDNPLEKCILVIF